MSNKNLIKEFMNLTGCSNQSEAEHFCEAANFNLQMALDLFWNQSASKNRPCSSKHNPDEVRSPIAPRRELINEQTFTETYGRGTRRARPTAASIFNQTGEAKYSDNDPFLHDHTQHQAKLPVSKLIKDQYGKKLSSLESLFRPPTHLVHEGSWESAKGAAKMGELWLLVNLQDVKEFACQVINRDVWNNSSVGELVRNNFLFWQVRVDSAEGRRFSTYYRKYITDLPFVTVIDPRTGEFMAELKSADAISFCDSALLFLEKNSFNTKNGFLGPESACSSSNHSPFKKNITCSNGHVQNGETPMDEGENGLVRKRKSESSFGDFEHPDAKKSKYFQHEESNSFDDMPDIDSIAENVEKEKRKDYWMKLQPNTNSAQPAELLFRFPNGSSEKIDIDPHSDFSVLQMFLYSRGYCSTDIDILVQTEMGKKRFPVGNTFGTLQDLGLSGRQVVIVDYNLDHEEDSN